MSNGPKAAQAILKNLTGDNDRGNSATPQFRDPTVGDYVHTAIIFFLAVFMGVLMFKAKRHLAMKAAIDRDRRVLGDLRPVTRSRAV